jgi:hypothetical protein
LAVFDIQSAFKIGQAFRRQASVLGIGGYAMIDGQSTSGPASRKKRRIQSRSKRGSSVLAVIRGARFGRGLFAAMCVVGAVYVGAFLQEARLAGVVYGVAGLGMNKNETRYLFGGAPAGQETRNVWTYLVDGAQISLRFGQDGRTNLVSCTETDQTGAGCPSILGLEVGTTEDLVWLKLGKPGREVYDGNDKIIFYDDLGLSFLMQRYQIKMIEIHKRDSGISFVPRAFWMMVP